MIYSDKFLDEIKNKLRLLYFNGDKTELVTFCPFCEGITGKKHGHLYISVDKPCYICHRCGKSGKIIDIIKELKLNISLNDSVKEEYIEYLNNNSYIDYTNNSKIIEKCNKYIYKPKNQINYDTNTLIDRKLLDNKLNFLQNRLNISYDSVLSIPKLILNIKILSDYLPDSIIENIEYYNENYVGFLTEYENYLILRRINDKQNLKRYISIKLKNNETSLAYYSVNIRKLDSNIPNLILAEGIFDILYTYYNRDLFAQYNVIKGISVLGKSNYKKIIDNLPFITKSFRNNLIILSDSDVSPFFFNIAIKNNPYVENYKILYNIDKKDWGE